MSTLFHHLKLRLKSNSSGASSMVYLLMTLLTCLGVTAILVVYVGYSNMTSKVDEIMTIHRKYLLRMETDGCLTAEESGFLTTELGSALGSTSSISLSGTTTSKVEYGKQIKIHIACKIPVSLYGFGTNSAGKPALSLSKGQILLPYDRTLYTVSKRL